MHWLMEPIYNIISWVLLKWHWLWDAILPDGRFLGTNWDWVLAIVCLVITVRLVLFPVFVKQIKSQRAMQTLAPKIKELQAKHKGDQQTLREEMMKLYQTEKVNPLMGCLPMFLQIPVFLGLFHVLKSRDPQGFQPYTDIPKTLYGWTAEQFDSAASAQLFGAPIPASFSTSAQQLTFLGGGSMGAAKIVAAVLVVAMMLTTFTSQRQMILKTGWQAEPQQKMIQRLMLYGVPASLLLSGWAFPIGVIIYWVTQNLFTLVQQQWVLRKYPPVISSTAAAPKTARERAAAAQQKTPNALMRFLLVVPGPPKPAGAPQGMLGRLAAKGGVIGRVAGSLRSGAPTAQQATTEPTPQRSLAPRPGAKPRTGTPASSSARITGETVSADGVIEGSLVDSAEDVGAVEEPAAPKTFRQAAPKTPKVPAAAKPAATQAPRASGAKPATQAPRASGAKPATSGTAAANGAAEGSSNGAVPKPKQPAGAGKPRSGSQKAAPRKGGQSGRRGGRR